MNKFDIDRFNKLIEQYFDFKKKTGEYVKEEWRVGGKNSNQCLAILNQLKEEFEALLKKNYIDSEIKSVEVSSGQGFFPKVPWIGFFYEGEKPQNGVYPVIAFQENEWFIGCTESIRCPQESFSELYHHAKYDSLNSNQKKALDDASLSGSEHLALMPTIFKSGVAVSEKDVVVAVNEAIRVYREYRKKELKVQGVKSSNADAYPRGKLCVVNWLIQLVPYIVIGILGWRAISKIDGCCPSINERTVTTTNEVLRVEFNCVPCNCEKVK